jgi:hypothetical protein
MKKIIRSAFFLILIISVTGCTTATEQAATPDSGKIITEQKSTHGCETSSGYNWCTSKNKCIKAQEEDCPNLVVDTLTRIKSATKIDFGSQTEGEFKWKTRALDGIKNNTVEGRFITATSLTEDQIKSIRDFMYGDEFKTAQYNVASGTESGYEGYEKRSFELVCLVNHTPADQDKDGKTNVKISCGIYNKQ